MNFMLELLVSLLIVLGGVFVLVGSIGLIKLPDLMTRLHAPTKATTLGLGGMLVGSMFHFLGAGGELSIHEVLISMFLFITAPVSAHFIAKAWLHHHPERKSELPPTGRAAGWSTYDACPSEQAGAAKRTQADRGAS